jgi:hypothetical protein
MVFKQQFKLHFNRGSETHCVEVETHCVEEVIATRLELMHIPRIENVKGCHRKGAVRKAEQRTAVSQCVMQHQSMKALVQASCPSGICHNGTSNSQCLNSFLMAS